MKRISPLMQMTMALVALATTLIILASLFFDLVPDRDVVDRKVRTAVAESLAVQVAGRLRNDSVADVEASLRNVIARSADLRSIAVRRSDGTVVVDSGGHAQHWDDTATDSSRLHQVSVPLQTGQGQRWGRVELAYAPDTTPWIVAFFKEPLVRLLLFMTLTGWLVFGLYMRRALQHLDPSSVVPERVQGAFDAMAEGIVVLDTKGQIMMCNRVFRSLHADLDKLPTGTRLGSLAWLVKGLPADADEHPWVRAMATNAPNAGTPVQVFEGADARQLIFNAAPIGDAGGAVRGCMVTVNDVTAIHRANDALREAMQELSDSKKEVERKNAELEHLATRDPLTGALNRRAFRAAYDSLRHKAETTRAPVACFMVDIDHFKVINDSHGHSIGDRAIQELARRLHDSSRSADLVCRWGGEEFCIVSTGLAHEGAAEFGERLRARVERECGAAVREVQGLRVTVSIGVAVDMSGSETMDKLVERADGQLYQAKRGGRNAVAMVWPTAAASPRGLAALPVDAVTGCLSADAWGQRFQHSLALARSRSSAIGCLVIGLDDHAAFTGPAGAAKVDAALGAAQRLCAQLHGTDVAVGRIGERTLAWVVESMTLDGCVLLAGRLVASFKAAPGPQGLDSPMTLSIGVDSLAAQSSGASTVVERAMQAMTRQRRGGGGGVTLFAPARGKDTSVAP